jgi:hypothetical protein
MWWIVLLLVMMAPVWRVAGSKTGYSPLEAMWRHYKYVKHIPVEEAKELARLAYLDSLNSGAAAP